MAYNFAAEFTFEWIGGEIEYIDGKMVCEHWAISGTTDIQYEIFNPLVMEDGRVQLLEEGIYHVYIVGEVLEEKSENYDLRHVETEYIFTAPDENVTYVRMGKGGDNGK